MLYENRGVALTTSLPPLLQHDAYCMSANINNLPFNDVTSSACVPYVLNGVTIVTPIVTHNSAYHTCQCQGLRRQNSLSAKQTHSPAAVLLQCLLRAQWLAPRSAMLTQNQAGARMTLNNKQWVICPTCIICTAGTCFIRTADT